MAKRALVLGGGFAGLAAVDALRRGAPPSELTIQLVDRQPHSAFVPALPDLLSYHIEPRNLMYSLAAHCKRKQVEFLQAEVEAIDPARLAARAGGVELSADAMIICLGCENNYFGREDMRRDALGLRTVAEAERIREEAARLWQNTAAGQTANILIVGGGYTGFEAAGHLSRLLRDVANANGGVGFRVRILEIQPRALEMVSDETRARGVAAAKRFGVEIRTETTIASYDPSAKRAILNSGEIFENAIVIWSAGVTPGPVCAEMSVPKTRGKRLAVDDFLRLPGNDRVFAAGDVAGVMPPGKDAPLRPAAQFAIAEGRRAAMNVLRVLRGEAPQRYAPRDFGYLLPLPGAASGVVFGRELRGRAPILLHYLMCVYRSRGGNRWGMLRDLLT